jgi:3-hydroxyisobutyrate dehydrogenase
MAGAERVAFLGLGIMGSRMAANLRRAGFEVIAWNRTPERAQELSDAVGAATASTPAAAARSADVTIVMVVDSPEVEQVLFGPSGAVEGMDPGHLCIDMSTIAPAAARAVAKRLAEHGVAFLDAPVTGSKPKAEDGTLTIMVGGDPADVERARPQLEAMGSLIVHVGPTGHGQAVKLLNNTLAAINTAAVAQAIATGRRLGLDLEAALDVIEAGSGASAMLTLKRQPMLEHDYEPLFKLAHMLKDVRHCLETAREAGAPFSLGEEAERLYAEADLSGAGESDFAAVMDVVERQAGV